MTPLTIRDLRKVFGSTAAVDGITLDIPAGDLFFLLGPSGCGKTTLLRMIAGFTDPTSGTIQFGPDNVTHLPPNKRDAGMVFQGYALWPHMTVRQNVAFGLEVRKTPKDQAQQRVDEALASVQLQPLADRKTNQLSGGQQQRVALARALVIRPRVLLLDEPLSNLDAKLRLEMRQKIRDICKQSGITGIYVTHDQKEALSMADGVAVLNAGKVMQVGPPRLLYERPANRFVAGFLGETNFVPAEVKGRETLPTGEDAVVLETAAGLLRSTVFPDDLPTTGNVTCSIRPETIHLHAADPPPPHAAAATPSHATAAAADPATPGIPTNTFHARRLGVIYLGEIAQYQLAATPPGSNPEGSSASAEGSDAAASTEALPLRAYELNPRLLDAPNTALTAQVAPEDVVILRD